MTGPAHNSWLAGVLCYGPSLLSVYLPFFPFANGRVCPWHPSLNAVLNFEHGGEQRAVGAANSPLKS